MKFVLLINLKLFKFANSFFLNVAEHERVFANKYENANCYLVECFPLGYHILFAGSSHHTA